MKKYICKDCNYTSNTSKEFHITLEKINDKQAMVYYVCEKCIEKEVE